MTSPAISDLDAASNVLLLMPTSSAHDDEWCRSLILPDESPRPTNIISITISDTAENRLNIWRSSERTPRTTAILSAYATAPTSPPKTGPPDISQGDVSIASLQRPSDFTGLGIWVTKTLPDLMSEGINTRFCLYSLTALSQYGERGRVYQLVHMLTRLLKSEGGVGHFHMDSGAHSKQTINTFTSLFETVVRVDDTDGVTIERRGATDGESLRHTS